MPRPIGETPKARMNQPSPETENAAWLAAANCVVTMIDRQLWPQQDAQRWQAGLLQRRGRRQTDALRMISISGDSMVPLLEHDDTVMLDYSQTRPSPPGIFILDDGVGLVAKRIEIIPSTTPQMLRISSENSAYSSYQRRIDEVHIIGRVVWFARRL